MVEGKMASQVPQEDVVRDRQSEVDERTYLAYGPASRIARTKSTAVWLEEDSGAHSAAWWSEVRGRQRVGDTDGAVRDLHNRNMRTGRARPGAGTEYLK